MGAVTNQYNTIAPGTATNKLHGTYYNTTKHKYLQWHNHYLHFIMVPNYKLVQCIVIIKTNPLKYSHINLYPLKEGFSGSEIFTGYKTLWPYLYNYIDRTQINVHYNYIIGIYGSLNYSFK